jgi:hypothetical protein
METNGYKHTEEWKESMRQKMLGRKVTWAVKGEKQHNWKGDNVSYGALHAWIRRTLGSPSYCVNCGIDESPMGKGIKRSYFHWANISHQYKRDLKDWMRMCYSCHKKHDMQYRLINNATATM